MGCATNGNGDRIKQERWDHEGNYTAHFSETSFPSSSCFFRASKKEEEEERKEQSIELLFRILSRSKETVSNLSMIIFNYTPGIKRKEKSSRNEILEILEILVW